MGVAFEVMLGFVFQVGFVYSAGVGGGGVEGYSPSLVPVNVNFCPEIISFLIARREGLKIVWLLRYW